MRAGRRAGAAPSLQSRPMKQSANNSPARTAGAVSRPETALPVTYGSLKNASTLRLPIMAAWLAGRLVIKRVIR